MAPTTSTVSLVRMPPTEETISGPSWNNSSEYPSLASNEFAYDLVQVESLLNRITTTLAPLLSLMETVKTQQNEDGLEVIDRTVLVSSLQAITEMEEQIQTLLGSMSTFAHCLTCIDGSNADAQSTLSKLQTLASKVEATTKPVSVFLVLAPETFLKKFFDHAHTRPFEFAIREERKYADTILSDKEEALIARLSTNGPTSWGELYNQISSNLRCVVKDPATGESRELGLAQVAGLIRDGDEATRKSAWHAIQAAWKTQEIAAASGLNALAGWRLELAQLRSKNRPVHFMESPIRSSRVQKETLDAMWSAVQSNIETPRRAMRAMAKAFGKQKLDPWDLLAPAPIASSEKIPFTQGLSMIRESFDSVHPSFSDFVDTMKKNRWIEGRSDLPNKRQGAFGTGFRKSRTPRVFQTYMGSLDDVRTLAHELGHAYHSWVMRDLPPVKSEYPMTLAETASIFAETVFADAQMAKARSNGDHDAAFEIAWQNGEAATSLLLNIAARFDFEYAFYNERPNGFVSAEKLSQLTSDAWTKWYGDTLSEPEKQFWMTKLHFSISDVSFYNFPYTFGYLFSLGVFALRQERGEDFWKSYTDLLRDTGSMTAEELAMKHLGVDLTKPEFWLKSLAIVEAQVQELEEIVSFGKNPTRFNQ